MKYFYKNDILPFSIFPLRRLDMEKVDQSRIGLADYCVIRKHTRRTKLDAIDGNIDWLPFERILRQHLHRVADAVGSPAYPPLLMFKCLVLQRLYDLSDTGLEECLVDRISFLRFVGLGMDDDIPDSTTICRFRNGLLADGLCRKLFDELVSQLRDKGLDISRGVAVDATVVRSSRRPRKVIDTVAVDRNEPDLHGEAPAPEGAPSAKAEQEAAVSHSADEEAAWTVKAGKAWYGWKAHMASDVGTGLILGGHVTPANRSDMNELPKVLAEIPSAKGVRCLADKGYASRANREAVRAAGMRDGIMGKAVRGRPLTLWARIRNRLISPLRCTIERLFGHMKRTLGFSRSRYVGMAKVEQEFLLVAFAADLTRAVTLMAAR